MFILSKTEASMGLHFAGTRGKFQRGMLIAALRLHQAPVIGQTLRRDARELRVERRECRISGKDFIGVVPLDHTIGTL